MSAPRVGVWKDEHAPSWLWQCGSDDCRSWGGGKSLAVAADSGRAHLAAHHTALMPQVAHGDGDDANGPHRAAQPFVDFAQAINRAHNASHGTGKSAGGECRVDGFPTGWVRVEPGDQP